MKLPYSSLPRYAIHVHLCKPTSLSLSEIEPIAFQSLPLWNIAESQSPEKITWSTSILYFQLTYSLDLGIIFFTSITL